MANLEDIKSESEKYAILEIKNNFGLKNDDFIINKNGIIKSLNLSSKNLSNIPEIIKKFIQLEKLNISHNKIFVIEEIKDLLQLRDLNLHSNLISKIIGLDNLSQLQNLNLLNNKIVKIEGLNKLNQLKNLNLFNNQIKKIEGLENCIKLEFLNLDNNPLSIEDRKVYEKGVNAVIEYCKLQSLKLT